MLRPVAYAQENMRRRITPVITLSALALIIFAALAAVPSVSSQTDNDGETVQVIARLHQNGRIEFGLRSDAGDQFPNARLFPPNITHENWLRSTPVELSDGTSVRIIARRVGNTRVEFGVRIDEPRQEFLPRSRFFPRSATVGRWLVSSPVALPAPTPATEPQATDTDATPTAETISGGHRDGLAVQGRIVGDPDAPVLIVDYGDPF